MSHHRSHGPLAVTLLLVMATTTLAILSYWLWQGKQRAEDQAKVAQQEREHARQGQTVAMNRVALLERRITRLPDLDFDQVLAVADDDIRQYGGGIPNESYADVVRRLQTLFENARAELEQVTTDNELLQQEYESLEKIKQVAVDVATANTQEARRDLLAERAEFHRQMAGKDSEIRAIFDRANTLASRLETEQRDKAKIREELLGEVNKLRRILTEARAPFTPNALANQKPDGKVVRASAATKTAWINVGSKHGVQTQFTFSVQPAGFSGNPFTKPKAKLEVVKVTGPDLSEARVVQASLTDPVLEGDLIYNPAWNPGRIMRFALAGLLDIDGDGTDDRPTVRHMIEKAGAKIDAQVLPDATVRGEVTVETNYFVRGLRPDPENANPVDLQVIAAMSRMERTALDYGATVLDLAKFLDLMGYASSRQASPVVPRLAPADNPLRRTSTGVNDFRTK
jgi:hypothetical protein